MIAILKLKVSRIDSTHIYLMFIHRCPYQTYVLIKCFLSENYVAWDLVRIAQLKQHWQLKPKDSPWTYFKSDGKITYRVIYLPVS